MDASLAQRCELCDAIYKVGPVVLESLITLSPWVLRLSTRAAAVFLLELEVYVAALVWTQTTDLLYVEDVQRLLHEVEIAIPYLLIGLLTIQLAILIPAIRVLSNRRRYLSYVCSNRVVALGASPPWFLILAMAGMVLSFFHAAVGSFFVVVVCAQVWTIHTSIVDKINKEIVRDALLLINGNN